MPLKTDTSSAVTQPPATQGPPAAGTFCLQAGTEPVPEYHLVELLGRGGFGEVWKATGPGGVPVAMKFVAQEEGAGALELRSLEFMKDIRHPHLLAIFGAWQCHGHVILAMELADRTLHERYKEAASQGLPGIPLGELLEYTREAAKGIDYLNSLGIQHRDIKPQNLFLVGGSVKVADFGLAKPLAPIPLHPGERAEDQGIPVSPHSGAMTPVYAPPEFFQGRVSDCSDQYSLAVSYCHLRTGRLPFGGETAVEVMSNVLDKPPKLEMLTAEERPVIARALAKSAKERWPNCRAFAAALTDCAPPEDQMLPEPRRPAEFDSVSRDGQHSPGTTGLARHSQRRAAKAAGLVLLVLLVLGYVAWRLDLLSWKQGPPMIEEACLRGHTAEVTCVAFAPDGRLLSGGADRTLRLWDGRNGDLLQTWDKHRARVSCLAITLDGKRAVSGSDDRSVRMWDLEDGQELWHSGAAKSPVTAIAFAPDGKTVVSGHDDAMVRVWDAASGKQLSELKAYTTAYRGSPRVTGVAVTADNQRIIASRGNTIGTWKTGATDKKGETGNFAWPGGFLTGDPIRSLALPADSHHVLLGQGALLRYCRIDDAKEVRHTRGHRDPITAVAVTQDGFRAVSASDDRIVRAWDLKTGHEIGRFTGHTGAVLAVAISSDGRHAASAGMDQTVQVLRLPP